MKRILSKLKSPLLIGTTTLLLMAAPIPASAFIVFDPANYQQNLLSAVRALQEIENQVKGKKEALAISRKVLRAFAGG